MLLILVTRDDPTKHTLVAADTYTSLNAIIVESCITFFFGKRYTYAELGTDENAPACIRKYINVKIMAQRTHCF